MMIEYLLFYAAGGALTAFLFSREDNEGWPAYVVGGIMLLTAFQWSAPYIVLSIVEMAIGAGAYMLYHNSKKGD